MYSTYLQYRYRYVGLVLDVAQSFVLYILRKAKRRRTGEGRREEAFLLWARDTCCCVQPAYGSRPKRGSGE